MAIKIIAADSYPIVTVGIEVLLSKCESVELLGVANSGTEIMDLASRYDCDVLVTDQESIQAESEEAEPLLFSIRSNHPELRIVVHARIDNLAQLATMAQMGIAAVLHPFDTVSHLEAAIKAAHSNASYFSPTLLRSESCLNRTNLDTRALTRRELQVLNMFLSGSPVCVIARTICRSKQTVSAHKARAMSKLGVVSDAELFRLKYRDGLFALLPELGSPEPMRASSHRPAIAPA